MVRPGRRRLQSSQLEKTKTGGGRGGGGLDALPEKTADSTGRETHLKRGCDAVIGPWNSRLILIGLQESERPNS